MHLDRRCPLRARAKQNMLEKALDTEAPFRQGRSSSESLFGSKTSRNKNGLWSNCRLAERNKRKFEEARKK